MLQVAIANPEDPTSHAPGYRRAVIVLGAVIAAHLLLLALTMAARDRMVERPVEPRTIVATLLSPEPATPAPTPAVSRPEPPAPVPPAAVTPPTPPAPRHVARVKPVPQPRAAIPREVETPARTAPSETPQPAPAQTAPAPTPAAPQAAPTPAPAVQPVAPASTAPRNVSHVDCTIPKPDYPDISKRRGENGTAVVRFVVGLTGRLESVQLQKSSGYPRLDDAALAAVHASECQPYSENGIPVRAAYSQSFVFGLSE
jgi:protein TonB